MKKGAENRLKEGAKGFACIPSRGRKGRGERWILAVL